MLRTPLERGEVGFQTQHCIEYNLHVYVYLNVNQIITQYKNISKNILEKRLNLVIKSN